MSRFFFGGGGTTSKAASIKSLSDNDLDPVADEIEKLQSALKDADLIMNDDLETAEKNLQKGNSAFHALGRGIIVFLQAVLGMEQEVMKDALDRLSTAESVAQEYQKQAQRDPRAHSVVYPAGSEYAVCQAQAQILSAIICVMNESLTDAVRGFYKLRKAMSILQPLTTHEKAYLEAQGDKHAAEALHGDQSAQQKESLDDLAERISFDSPIDRWIQSTTSCQSGMMLTLISLIPPAFSRLLSIVGFYGDRDRGLALLWRATRHGDINGAVAAHGLLAYCNGLVTFLEIKTPSFYPAERLKTLLSTMRARYPQSELWRLEEARMASVDGKIEQAVTILGAHNGPLGEPLSADAGTDGASSRKTMKQVQALQTFERALNSAYIHAYALTATNFVRNTELSSWSHSLCLYAAAAAHLELYRIHKHGGLLPVFPADAAAPTTYAPATPDAAKAAAHAAQATAFLDQIPALAGKKRLLARQLPFDTYVTRKLAKWQARATAWGVPLVDAAGVSPLTEAVFFFGGFGRTPRRHLHASLARLAWSDGDTSLLSDEVLGATAAQALPAASPHAAREGLDERAALAVLRGAILNSLGRTGDARALLTEAVVAHARGEFAAVRHGENWTAPMARYELAAGFWAERYEGAEGSEGAGVVDGEGRAVSRDKLGECARWLDEVARWGSFDLDVRTGIKVTVGKEALKKLGVEV